VPPENILTLAVFYLIEIVNTESDGNQFMYSHYNTVNLGITAIGYLGMYMYIEAGGTNVYYIAIIAIIFFDLLYPKYKLL
jgi:hypothetical protein